MRLVLASRKELGWRQVALLPLVFQSARFVRQLDYQLDQAGRREYGAKRIVVVGDDFKSTVKWPGMAEQLPTYTGGKDRAQGRKMIDNLGGPYGFKTSQQTNADGSVTTCQLKGDMPAQFFRTVVDRILKYVEKDYMLRVYQTASVFYTFFMKDTPLLYNMELRTQLAPTDGSIDNEFYYDRGPLRTSVDGMQTARFRKTKKANIHFFSDGTDNDTTFPDTGQTYFPKDHTVTGAPGFEWYVTRVKPINVTPMTIRGKSEELYFKKPPDAITTNGITHFDDIVCFGLPWHGVYSPGIITLTNGAVVATHPSSGAFIAPVVPTHHTYINFNRPPAPAGTPEELAAGMTWKNDIVLCGQNKVYAGSRRSSLLFDSYYSSLDGSIHQIRYEWLRTGSTWYFTCYESISGQSFYYIIGLPCPIHLVQYPQTGSRVFWKNWFGAKDYEFCRQSPDGSRCLVIPPSYDDIYRPDYMLELQFSGGNNQSPLTVTHRKVDEWFAASSHVQVGTNYSFGISPGPVPTYYPDSSIYSFSETQNNPISIGYTKDNKLVFEKLERLEWGDGSYTSQGPPLLSIEISSLYYRTAFITYIEGVEVRRHEETVSMVGGEVATYRTAYLTVGFVYRLFDVGDPAGWPPALDYPSLYYPNGTIVPLPDPIITPSVNTGPSWNGTVNPGFMSRYFRVGNNLTIQVQYRYETAVDNNGYQYSINNRYAVLGAWAYGESVPGLIGYEYAVISGETDNLYKTSFNPRTQEILFYGDRGWA